MVAHVLPVTDHDSLVSGALRLGRIPAALILVSVGLPAAILLTLAPALVCFGIAVAAAGLWRRSPERHGITDERDSQDFLRHSLAHLQGQSPTVADEETVR